MAKPKPQWGDADQPVEGGEVPSNAAAPPRAKDDKAARRRKPSKGRRQR
jgi:hypothetical protein